MMRAATWGVLIVLFAAASARAQSTDAGVDAYLRGDYETAAHVLKPIAESPFDADPAAQFFMATMYADGLGIPADAVRACALYVRASASQGPFGRLAQDLVPAAGEALGEERFRECMRVANTGFDTGFEAVTFELEAGYWVRIDRDGATVTDNRDEKRTELDLAPTGAVFMPIEHTELAFPASQPPRRHFIEFFVWIPDRGRTWVLQWHVFEVVRTDLISILVEDLAKASGERPPTAASFKVRDLARLRVSSDGQAEWVVLDRERPRSGVIESPSERDEREERSRARKAAEARIDWTRVRDARRAPGLSYVDGDGCGGLFLFGWSANRDEVMTIRGDEPRLALSTTPRTFNLDARDPQVEIAVHVYSRTLRSLPFCNDVGIDVGDEEVWKAATGTVTLQLSPPPANADTPAPRRATIEIAGAEFVGPSGVRVRQSQPIRLSVIVWRGGVG